METPEHTKAGNQILAEYNTLNHYLSGGSENEGQITPLSITVMALDEHGLPLPTSLRLTAGQIVALAGDYFTKPGWGLKLQVPPSTNESSPFLDAATIKRTKAEKKLFIASYQALANKNVSKSLIDEIYRLENDYAKKPSAIRQYINQLKLMYKVPGYYTALNNNEAHFAPWSTSAYIVGHQLALHYAKLSYKLQQFTNQPSQDLNQLDEATYHLVQTILKANPNQNLNVLLTNYTHRYHALAIAMDLAALHYYSDHFAAGHLSQLGLMRELLPAQFGFIGQTLVNSMHNEGNQFGIFVTHEKFQQTNHDGAFVLPQQVVIADGDGTYDRANNDENANDMIDGMSASLGDIYKVAVLGESLRSNEFTAKSFLPMVANNHYQYQPLFVLGKDNQIYSRKDLATVKKLSSSNYQALMQNPSTNQDYAKLTWFGSLKIFLRLRVATMIPYFWPAPQIKDNSSGESAVKRTTNITPQSTALMSQHMPFDVHPDNEVNLSTLPRDEAPYPSFQVGAGNNDKSYSVEPPVFK